jgi:ElaB/YqjD/DUF883 family membrane-anchored ribosome-binding protein
MDPTSPSPGTAPQQEQPSNGTPFQPGSAPRYGGGPESPPLSPLQLAFRERFEALLPTIQREWPEVARHTLEATRGSFDHAVEVISRQTGLTSGGVKQQLQDLLQTTGEQAHQVADTLRPLEDQLEQLLDDLNATLRPRIEKPVREKPLMALGIAAGVGLLFGLLLSGRRSA